MKISNLCKTYHNRHEHTIALDHISFEINNCGITAIIGPSGCGKTTLLKIMSKSDTDYTGDIEIDGITETIPQEIQLLESMSVFDNLFLVCSDKNRINHFLEHFQMFSFTHKKVKKLSSGQKKRVQIIRSLLMQPKYLLCDEPTASLDFENAKLVMDMLQEISNKICVIMVTHEISLVDKYADTIMQMGKGVILSITQKNEKPILSEVVQKQIIPTPLQYIKTEMHLLASRKLENLQSFILLFILCICIFTTTLFGMVNISVDAKEAWRTKENILIPVANEGNSIYRHTNTETIDKEIENIIIDQKKQFAINNFGSEDIDLLKDMPIYYDIYTNEDISIIKDNTTNIIGYNTSIVFGNIMKAGSFCPTIISDRDKNEYSFDNSNYMGYQDVFIDSMGIPAVDLNATILAENPDPTQIEGISSMHFDVYQIFDRYTMPVHYGKWLDDDKDVVLSSSAAEKLRKELQLDSVEALIGKELEIRLDKYKAYGKYGQEAVHSSNVATTLTISGISYNGRDSEFDDQYEMFVKDGVWTNILADYYELDANALAYTQLALIVDDHADIPSTILEVEDLLASKESHFVTARDISQVKYRNDYQNPLLFYAFFILLSIGLSLVYIAIHFINRKRDTKEQKILVHYGYIPWRYTIIKLFVYFFLIFIIQMLILPYIITTINVFANQLGYAYLIQGNIMTYLMCFTIAILYCLLCEAIFIIIRKRR